MSRRSKGYWRYELFSDSPQQQGDTNQYYRRECTIWARISADSNQAEENNLLQFFGFLESYDFNQMPAFVARYYALGDARSYINQNTQPRLSNKQKIYLISDIAKGLTFIHSTCGVAHRDVRGSNILLKAKEHRLIGVLGDFGSAKEFTIDVPWFLSSSDSGGDNWCPPEYKRPGGFHDDKGPGDIWSLGCTMLELLQEEDPWYQVSLGDIPAKIAAYEHPPKGAKILQDHYDFITACWTVEDRRPNANDLQSTLPTLNQKMEILPSILLPDDTLSERVKGLLDYQRTEWRRAALSLSQQMNYYSNLRSLEASLIFGFAASLQELRSLALYRGFPSLKNTYMIFLDLRQLIEVSINLQEASGEGGWEPQLKVSHDSDLSTFDPEFWDDREGGRAFIKTTFECAECTGASNVIIDSIELDTEVWKVSVSVEVVTLINRQESHYARVIHCSLDHEEFPAEFSPGDQFSIICELCLAPPDDFFEDSDALLNHVGRYCLEWRRLSEEGNPGLSSSTQFSLPDLKPPPGGLVALLDAPPLAHLHQPFMLELSLRNRHPTRSACPMVSLELEPTESFVAAGIRNGRLATLIPGAEEKVVWQLIPLECGPAVLLPKIKVTDRRRATEGPESETGGAPQQPEGLATDDEIQVVDVRWDRRRSDGSCIFSDTVHDPSFSSLNLRGDEL
ncbi:hypothetical protein A7U60_g4971 [Sanghuangporus baumii]|uniref:Protein kinase domain-containing protein n=1 Tax=Sanghuangporus baumii TaxID=108892 RepID=A0A9Q5HXI5_SANBA|nr:hypothetical protein A7U60_g4971 [Sanghuangporus baumii]